MLFSMPRPLHALIAALIVGGLAATGCSSSDIVSATCPDATVNIDGRCVKACTRDRQCLAGEECVSNLCTAATGGDPRILRFDVTPDRVGVREQVRISYSVAGATEVRIFLINDDGLTQLTFEDRANFTGVINSPELTNDVTVRLVAFHPTRPNDVEERDVNVVFDDELRIASFRANPEQVSAGGTTTLSWSVRNAEGPVTLNNQTTNELLLDDGESVGTLIVPVAETTIYELVARGSGGQTARSEAMVTVVDRPVPSIDAFEVAPTQLASGHGALLSWSTSNADRIVLRPMFAFSTPPLYSSTVPAYVAAGAFVVVPSSAVVGYTLTAFAGDRSVQALRMLSVDPAPAVARIDSFTAEPEIIRNGADLLTLNWSAIPDDVSLTLSLNGEPVDAADLSQQYVTPVTDEETVVADLFVDAPGGAAHRRVRAWARRGEEEDNDDPPRATDPLDKAIVGDMVNPDHPDEDWFSVNASPGSWVRVNFLDGTNCPPDFVLQLLNQGGEVPIAEDRPGVNGECPFLQANLRTNEQHYVRLAAEFGPSDLRYTLGIAIDEPRCGDGVLIGDEECDDGNLRRGDGCSTTCSIEPEYRYEMLLQPPQAWEAPPSNALAVQWLPYSEGQLLPASDEGFAVIPLPTGFTFFGRDYVGVVVHSNGYLSFSQDLSGPGIDTRQPWGEGRPNALLAVAAADLFWRNGIRPRVWTANTGTNGRILWIDFSGGKIAGDTGTIEQARVGLTAQGAIIIQYGEVSAESSFASGIEDPTGTFRLSYCSNGGICENGFEASNSFAVFRNTSL